MKTVKVVLKFIWGSIWGSKEIEQNFWLRQLSLVVAIMLALTFRWLIVEPYVIPSGSMLPTLLIHDHIFASKLSFGIRAPFTSTWIYRKRGPERGEVIIFRTPEPSGIFLIKRVVAIPGDHLSWDGETLSVNGEKIPTIPNPNAQPLLASAGRWLEDDPARFDVTQETMGDSVHGVFLNKSKREMYSDARTIFTDRVIPPDHFFAMGDNRDNSHDSRWLGPIPFDNIIGKALFIWLSCEENFSWSHDFVCNPTTVRWKRFFKAVD